jgi:hypothetical protein
VRGDVSVSIVDGATQVRRAAQRVGCATCRQATLSNPSKTKTWWPDGVRCCNMQKKVVLTENSFWILCLCVG